jgi:hypothetical protein
VTERLEVWLRTHGRWGWRYRGPHGVIPAARDLDRFDDAVDAARRAYPGVPLVEVRPRLNRPVAVAVAAAAILVLLLGRRQASRTSRA